MLIDARHRSELRPDVSRLDPQRFGDVGLLHVCADEREGLRGRSIGRTVFADATWMASSARSGWAPL